MRRLKLDGTLPLLDSPNPQNLKHKIIFLSILSFTFAACLLIYFSEKDSAVSMVSDLRNYTNAFPLKSLTGDNRPFRVETSKISREPAIPLSTNGLVFQIKTSCRHRWLFLQRKTPTFQFAIPTMLRICLDAFRGPCLLYS